ncbi:MAG: DUF393 domain-containing protein [Candidatus Nanohaloarchaea archaeon]|nr:DUF393 domain-containing protein [Candidatus Nanohaloarchaea archaeon]
MATAVYDGGCGFCTDFKRVMAALDWLGRFDWVDLHEADYAELPVSEEDCIAAMQVIDGGEVYAGFYAVRRILRSIPLLFPLYVFFLVPGVPILGERVYAWVARHRHCQV